MTTSPQLENGYTRIANEILEALTLIKLTSQETKAILLIIRNTYGFQRKVWNVDKWTVFEKTGIHKCNVKATLTKLANRQIIKLKWNKKLISFQKDYSLWDEKVSQPANLLDADIEEEVSQPANFDKSEVSQPANRKLVNQLKKVSQPAFFTPENVNDSKHPQESKESKENKETLFIDKNDSWKYDGWREHFDIGKKFIEEQNNFYFSTVLKGNITNEQLRMIAFIGSKGEYGRAVVKDKAGKATNQINIITWAYDELSGNGKQKQEVSPPYHQIVEFTEPPKLDEKTSAIEAECKRIRIEMRANNRSSADILQAMEEYKDAQASK